MAREKSYSPVASYEQLKQAEASIEGSVTAEDIREATKQHGAKVGYKAFCYMLIGKMTPEGMKPDEAVVVALQLETEGKVDEPQEIYRCILAEHPDHELAKSKLG